MVILSVLPISLFVFKVAKLVYLYRSRVAATVTQTFAAALAGLSLSHTIAKAILVGLVIRSKPFFRTPKLAGAHALLQALLSAREEGLILIALWLAAAMVAKMQGSDTPDLLLWIIVLLIQSIPYLAAVTVSLVSGFSRVPNELISKMTRRGDS